MLTTNQTVVIDSGSGFTKAGFSGFDAPESVLTTAIGSSTEEIHNNNIITSDSDDTIVGEETINREFVSVRYPIERGLIKNFDDMETIWDYIFCNELKVDSKSCNILLSEICMNPKCYREEMTRIMFERFQVGGMYCCMQSVLALYASGRINGLVVDVGHGVSHTVPVYDGYAFLMASSRLDIAGRDVTDHLTMLLLESGYNLSLLGKSSISMHEIVRDIKEKLCYIALDYESEPKKPVSYELPDGSKISVGNERFKGPELLFEPSYLGNDEDGIHKKAYRSLRNCDIDLRAGFYSNILLSGGSSMFEGFSERLHKEMTLLSPPSTLINIIPARKHSAWIGGSILSSLTEFQSRWISVEEYEEAGPSIVHRKTL